MGENDDKTECSKPIAEEEPATAAEPVAAASTTSAEEQSSATGDEGSIDIDADAQLLMAQGKRNLVIGEVVQAVQAFQEASALLAAKYGESAKECGEAYFKYGCALLELARMETGVLGNALDGVPDEAASDSDEDTTEKVAGSNVIESAKATKGSEREKIFKDVYSALDANSKERKKEKAKKENACEESGDVEMESTENGKEDDVKVNKEQKEGSKVEPTKKQEKVEEMETDKDSNKEDMETEDSNSKDTKAKKEGKKKEDEGAGCSKEDDQAGTTDGEAKTDEEGENADDIPNFQLAWEMLELSRVIFLKIDKEAQLKVAHVHLTLGELGMETENYAQSIDDFLKCLAIRIKHLDDDSRLLAETHYNLGLVYGLDKQFDKSIESYEKSKAVIEQRIINLRKDEKEAEQEKEKENTDLASIRKEISELEELVPDIIAKIEDAKELMKNADDPSKKAIIAAAAEFGVGPGASSSSGFAQSSTSSAPAQRIAVKQAQKTDDPAKDITYLLRKKRKPEGNGDANETKKSRNDETSNGNGDATNGHGNGDATNGHANGDGQKAQKEIKQKTVEDVKAAKECSMETA